MEGADTDCIAPFSAKKTAAGKRKDASSAAEDPSDRIRKKWGPANEEKRKEAKEVDQPDDRFSDKSAADGGGWSVCAELSDVLCTSGRIFHGCDDPAGRQRVHQSSVVRNRRTAAV